MVNDPENAKFDDLATRIKQAQAKPVEHGADATKSAMKASRIGFDFMGAVMGGLLVGWLLDSAVPSLAPWGMIGSIFLGFGAGMMAETVYNMIANMVESTAGEKARPFFPFIFSIFIFILFCNLLGLLPGSLAVTSHIVINFAIAILLFTVIIIAGFVINGAHFLQIFAPPGVPFFVLVFLVPIEIFSFLVRPFSLSVRLFANMLAGHILLGVFAGMTISLFAAGVFLKPLGLLPLVANIAITGFEFFVAVLQAYIYAILAAVYLRDAVEAH